MNNNTTNTPNNNQNQNNNTNQNIPLSNNVNPQLNTQQNIVNQTVPQQGTIPPSVSTVVTPNNTNQVKETSNNKEDFDDNIGPSKGKVVLLLVFFILVLVFVVFLPDISSIIKTGKFSSNSNEIANGTLSCSMTKSLDNTETTYEMNFSFTNKKLQVSTLNITTESEDKNVINEKYLECKNIEEISDKTSGIDVSCSSSSSISTMRENYTYNIIDTNNLTKFTEAGGTYPEHEFEQDIYDIKSSMIKNGYDCEIKSR